MGGPELRRTASGVITASHDGLGDRFLYCEDAGALLFTQNETNTQRLFGTPNRTPYVKDGIGEHVVHGCADTVNPAERGTKASAHYALAIDAGKSATIRLRLRDTPSAEAFGDFAAVMAARRREADAFYATVIPASLDADATNVMRQALAGMLWSKQFYHYDVDLWLAQHRQGAVGRGPAVAPRNQRWRHLYNAEILSMPDKWEYPWYAAWDMAFHVIALTLVDEDFGKHQLHLMLRDTYLHPNGQIPAYEWNFGDVNPPVQAWSTIFTYKLDLQRNGHGDLGWLERVFHKPDAELHLVGEPQGP